MVMRQRPTLADQRSHQWSMLPLQLLRSGGSAAIQAAISGAIGDKFKQAQEGRAQTRAMEMADQSAAASQAQAQQAQAHRMKMQQARQQQQQMQQTASPFQRALEPGMAADIMAQGQQYRAPGTISSMMQRAQRAQPKQLQPGGPEQGQPQVQSDPFTMTPRPTLSMTKPKPAGPGMPMMPGLTSEGQEMRPGSIGQIMQAGMARKQTPAQFGGEVQKAWETVPQEQRTMARPQDNIELARIKHQQAMEMQGRRQGGRMNVLERGGSLRGAAESQKQAGRLQTQARRAKMGTPGVKYLGEQLPEAIPPVYLNPEQAQLVQQGMAEWGLSREDAIQKVLSGGR